MFTSADEQTVVEPVLQVLSAKAVSTVQGSERWRLILSDGSHFSQGMLATNLNSVVQGENPQVARHSVIKLTGYAVNNVQGRRVIIILSLEPLGSHDSKIGEPATIEQGLAAAGYTAAGSNGSAAAAGTSAPAPVNDAVSAPPAPAAPAAAPRGGSNASRTSAAKRSSSQGGPGAGGGLSKEPLYPIEALSPYQNKCVPARFRSHSGTQTDLALRLPQVDHQGPRDPKIRHPPLHQQERRRTAL